MQHKEICVYYTTHYHGMHQYKPSGSCPQLVMNKKTIFFFCFITMKFNSTESHMSLVGHFQTLQQEKL